MMDELGTQMHVTEAYVDGDDVKCIVLGSPTLTVILKGPRISLAGVTIGESAYVHVRPRGSSRQALIEDRVKELVEGLAIGRDPMQLQRIARDVQAALEESRP